MKASPAPLSQRVFADSPGRVVRAAPLDPLDLVGVEAEHHAVRSSQNFLTESVARGGGRFRLLDAAGLVRVIAEEMPVRTARQFIPQPKFYRKNFELQRAGMYRAELGYGSGEHQFVGEPVCALMIDDVRLARIVQHLDAVFFQVSGPRHLHVTDGVIAQAREDMFSSIAGRIVPFFPGLSGNNGQL